MLGGEYEVLASVGHVRDLLRSKLSVDVDNDFTPRYRVPNEKRPVVKELKQAAAKAEQVYLATDPDREGEAIAWHLVEAAEIDPDIVRRVVFHEITPVAIAEAFKEPRTISMKLVDAQQARRILDRLVGYKISPLLWAKVRSRLSAGRVQSAALRLVVEREREIEDFEPQEYWTIDAELEHPQKPPAFRARLSKVGGQKAELGSEHQVEPLLTDMRSASYEVAKVARGKRTRRPNAPFTTSTLQQAASRRFGYTARRTMAIAQQLYEGVDLGGDEREGLITYMRTDSTQVSSLAIDEARRLIHKEFGSDYVPAKPVKHKTRARRAQEAHEAIRPTSVWRKPADLIECLSKEQAKLYTLIWQRFIASQMRPAVYDTLTLEISSQGAASKYELRATASSIRFPGFLRVFDGDERANGSQVADRTEAEPEAQLAQLPALEQGDHLNLLELFPDQHFTQPPRRFSDATLVSMLEEHGIGRPSTYAPIISTLRQRGYVERKNRRLSPTEIGELVNDLIVEHFPNIVDLGFTARMEDELDEIADGERPWVDVVRAFYEPFSVQVERAETAMPEMKAEPEELGRDCPECGHPLLIRHGRYGKFIGCSNFPECRHTEPWLEKIGVECPLCEGELVERRTRRGRIFYGCANYPECEFTSWKRPLPAPCPNCAGLLVVDGKRFVRCTQCEQRFPRDEIITEEADMA
jgi:DNA topoisomerase-1